MNTEFINEVKNLIVTEATKNGVNLSSEFSSTEAFKNAVIEFAFAALHDMGFDTEFVFDAIFGNGAFSELFTQLEAMA